MKLRPINGVSAAQERYAEDMRDRLLRSAGAKADDLARATAHIVSASWWISHRDDNPEVLLRAFALNLALDRILSS